MNKYVGYECPVCKKKFQPEDDVVVCPVCGAPHHRSCYQQNGGCALEDQHALGKEWQPPQQQTPPGGVCPVCGAAQAPGSQYCHNCGSLLGASPKQEPPRQNNWGGSVPPQGQNWNQPNPGQGSQWNNAQGGPWAGPGQNSQSSSPWGGPQSGPQNSQWNGQQPPWNGQPSGPSMPPFGHSPYGVDMNEEIDGISIKEYAAMVGPSSPYYILRFKAMSGGRKSTWNWGAFFFNFLYFFYRKMYTVGILLAVLFVTSLLPTFLYTLEYMQELVSSGAAIAFPLPQIYTPHMEQLMLMQSFLRMLWFVAMLLCGLWANKLYFSSVKNTILQIRQDQRSQDVNFYIHALVMRGGISKGAVIAIIGILFLAYMTFSYFVGITVLG